MIASLYADALFKQATKENNLDRIVQQFDRFISITKDNPDWFILLDTASIRNKVKLQLLEELNIFDKNFINFLMILIKNHHIILYHAIFEHWLILTRRNQKVAYVNLYTAKPLTTRKLNNLKHEIQDFLPGMKIEFQIQIDPTLIRGIKIMYQGRSIERSLRRTLDAMKSNI